MSVAGVIANQNVGSYSLGDKIWHALSSVYEKIKIVSQRAWNFLSKSFGVLTGYGNIFFFRALEWIHPKLALRCENFFLRVKEAFNSWREKDIRKEREELLVENRALHTEALEGLFFKQENQALKERLKTAEDELVRMTHSNQFLVRFNQELELPIASLQQENGCVPPIIGSVSDLKKFYDEHVSQLRATNKELQERVDELEKICQTHQKMISLQKMELELSPMLAAEKNQMEAYVCQRDHLLEEIVQGVIGSQNENYPSRLDPPLHQLRSLLIRQIESIIGKIATIRNDLPDNNPASILVMGLERILPAFKEELEKMGRFLQIYWGEKENAVVTSALSFGKLIHPQEKKGV